MKRLNNIKGKFRKDEKDEKIVFNSAGGNCHCHDRLLAREAG